MKINKKCWHFKLADAVATNLSWDIREGRMGLCEYFWRVIGGGVTLLGVVGLCIGFGAVVLSALIVPVYLLLELPVYNDFMGLAFMGWFSAGLGVGAAVITWMCAAFQKMTSNTKREPSLLSQRLTAHKAKVCPLMEFEEE